MSRKILPWAPLDGLQPTPIEGLELIRSDTPTTCVSSVYEPSLCLIAQGGKTVWPDVKLLADQANMSESSLFQGVKQVTRMSPLQFQKKLRLLEARRLMLSEGLEAATASFQVGYKSPSHFSREHSCLSGAPPPADVIKLRGEQPHPGAFSRAP